MLDFFVNLGEFLVSIIMFATNLILSLVNFLSMIPTYASLLIETISFLPSFYLPYCIVTILLCVVLFIFNRG